MIVGLGRRTGKLLLGGGAAAPIPDSPMLPGEMPWALLINQHLLSTYYVPATLHLSLHLAFSTILNSQVRKLRPTEGRDSLGVNPGWHRARNAGEARELWSRCEEGQRREGTFSMVSLTTRTAHSHSHPRQIIIIIHSINGHSHRGSLYPGQGAGARLQSQEGCVLLPAPF